MYENPKKMEYWSKTEGDKFVKVKNVIYFKN